MIAGVDLAAPGTLASTTPHRLPLQYFKSKATLPSTAYWHGIIKNDTLFTFADHSPVPNNYSSSPYAHWAFSYHAKLQQGGLNCVAARSNLAYDYFIGESTQLATKAAYSTTDDNKYGWVAGISAGVGCSVAAPCQPTDMLARRRSRLAASRLEKCASAPALIRAALACPLQLGPGQLQHGCVRLHLRGARHLVPLLPTALAQPAAALAPGQPAATCAALL